MVLQGTVPVCQRRMPCAYFFTCAGGLEPFALEEAAGRWPVLPVDTSNPARTQGKIFVASAAPISAAAGGGQRPLLCAAERAYVQVLRQPAPRGDGTALVADIVNAVRGVDLLEWRRCAELQRHLSRSSDAGAADGRRLQIRVCAKVGGKPARETGAPAIAAAVGVALVEHVTGWQLDDSRPDAVQVYVQCNEGHLLVGLAASGAALSEREDVPHPGLRSSVAWAAANLALGALEPGAGRGRSGLVLCDPFCGRGSLLLEAARDWDCAAVLAGDAALPSDAGLRSELQGNFSAAASSSVLVGAAVGLDACVLPYRTGSVDVLLTDPPFGKQHGDAKVLNDLYPNMLVEMRRVVTESTGRLVLLCPQAHWCFFQTLVLPRGQRAATAGSVAVWQELHCWKLDMAHPLRLGQVAVQLCRLLPTHLARGGSAAAAVGAAAARPARPADGGGGTNTGSGGQVMVGGKRFTRRALQARCREITTAAQGALVAAEAGAAHITAVPVSGTDGDFIRGLLSELQTARASAEGARDETKKERRVGAALSDTPGSLIDVRFGVNPQAPHTRCFLIGGDGDEAGASMSCGASDGSSSAGKRERLVEAKLCGLEPLSLKRAVDELCAVPNHGRAQKKQKKH